MRRLGAPQQRLRDLRPGLHALRERLVEHREARRHQRPPGDVADEQLVVLAGPALEQVARADQLGGDAVADADVDREHPVEHEHPRARAAAASHSDIDSPPASTSNVTAVTAGRATSRMRTSSSSARSTSRSSR